MTIALRTSADSSTPVSMMARCFKDWSTPTGVATPISAGRPELRAQKTGGLLMPQYHGRVQIELIGQQMKDGTVLPPRRRPKPNSPVFPLDKEQTGSILGIQGDFRLGLADGFDDLAVNVNSSSKAASSIRADGMRPVTGGREWGQVLARCLATSIAL